MKSRTSENEIKQIPERTGVCLILCGLFPQEIKDNQNKTYDLYGETKGLFERKRRSDEGLLTGEAVGS
ncbi:hypothetical protein [Proteiniphilum sp. UBA5346]|uniref:hypothetical protein n=1 Tax=Proteiniphilum sp. UBA5346 TaxID=1947277 RepID=UPI00257EBFB3|nr:hypothetical protein [Proteiniphilum sp. UBA5346]